MSSTESNRIQLVFNLINSGKLNNAFTVVGLLLFLLGISNVVLPADAIPLFSSLLLSIFLATLITIIYILYIGNGTNRICLRIHEILKNHNYSSYLNTKRIKRRNSSGSSRKNRRKYNRRSRRQRLRDMIKEVLLSNRTAQQSKRKRL